LLLTVIKRLTITIVLFILIYFGTAILWSFSAVNELLPDKAPASPLTSDQETMLLTIEDPRFYQHRGVDISQGQGLTTITSSIARDIFLFEKTLTGTKGVFQQFYRGIFTCCKRIDMARDMMAVVLNTQLSKTDQLNLYVATTYFGSLQGHQIIGFENAAISYYHKKLTMLTEEEFIGLVAMIKAPLHYNPLTQTDAHLDRVERIKKLIHHHCEADGWFDTTYDNCAP